MPRSTSRSRRRRYSSSSSASFSPSSDSDQASPPPPRNSRRQRSSTRKNERALRSLEKGTWGGRRYDGETDSSEDSWEGDSSSGSSSDSSYGGPGRGGGKSRPSGPLPPSSSQTAQQQQTRRCLVLFFGVAIALVLVLLASFAILRYLNQSGSSSGGSTGDGEGGTTKEVTVTVTASDGRVSTKVSLETSAGASATSSASTSSSSGSSSSSSSSSGSSTAAGISKNNIAIGFLPDYNDQTMSDITDGLGIKSSFYGWYAQLPESGDWDGSQLLSQMDDLKACNCIFQPAVMPTKGWAGLTEDDNSQALAIAKVMKQFTDEGIEVWIRFAHEVNYYITDGTYQGSMSDFKTAWAVVAAALADNDKVFMFFTPNVASSLDDYVSWMPDDTSTIDYLGIDYYPKSSSESFVDRMQPLYDKYCSDGSIKFAIGETGSGWDATIEERLGWLNQTTSEETAKAMPHYVGVSWFNYDKEEQFKLWIADDSSTNDVSKAWFAEGTVAEGAAMGNG
ncbi:hypothetical protein JCM8547_000093 [Rhodosporidiobolus lusitaniae]